MAGSNDVAAGHAPARLGLALLLLTALVLVASGWLQDDAFVTFRTLDNFLHGRGLTWNPGERVQVYTHPLWLFLIAGPAALTGAYELSCLVLAIALSLATVYLLIFHAARSVAAGCVVALALLVSKAYVDYATSGLEDPLTRLLLVVFVLADRRWRHDPVAGTFAASLVAALATLSRPDALLVFVPALAARLYRGRSRRALAAAAGGFLPLLLWGIFALFYYGSPFPNTAYAKLGTGVPRLDLVVQGLAYLLDSLIRDPATLVIVAGAVAMALRGPRRVDVRLIAGGLLYLLYVVWIGGDYMSGRFLGLPLLAAVLALARHPLPAPGRRAAVLGLALAALLTVPRMAEPMIHGEIGVFGIGDERRVHHPYTGLVHAFSSAPWPQHFLRARGERSRAGPSTRIDGAIGMSAFYGGPDVYVVDVFALADPLRARLPGIVRSTSTRPHEYGWRSGHMARPMPEGYLESLETGENRIADPDLKRYYDAIRRITRGPLWDAARLRAVVRLNLGAYDSSLRAYVERHGELFGSPSTT